MSSHRTEPDHYFSAHPSSKPEFGLIRACLRGKSFEFITASGVFSKTKIDAGTRLLIECMILPEKGCVLDVGCGYGALGIAAAKFNPSLNVCLVDVNSRAVRLARENVERNRVLNAKVTRGCFYEPFENQKFVCVLSNPPITAGMETVKAIIAGAPERTCEGGLFEMVVRSKVSGKRLPALIEEAFGNVEVLARESGYRVLVSRKGK